MSIDEGLGRAVLELTTTDRGFSAGIDKADARGKALRRTFAGAGSDVKSFGSAITTTGRQANAAMDGMATAAKKVGAAIVTYLSVSALAGAVKGYVDYASSIQDLSKKAGTGVVAFQKLSYAAKLNGADMEQVAAGTAKLGKTLVEGKASAVKAVETLGLNFRELRRMDPAEAFITIGDAVAKIPNPMQRSALATQIFGKAGADYLPMFQGNLRATADEAERLGLVLSEDAVAAADDLGDTLDRLQLVGMSVLGEVLTPMAPQLIEIATSFGDLAREILPKVAAGLADVVAAGQRILGGAWDEWQRLPEPLREATVAAAQLTAGLWTASAALAALKGSALVTALAPAAGYLASMARLVQFGGLGGLALIFRNWGAALTEGVIGPLGIVVAGVAALKAGAGSWRGMLADIGSVLRGQAPGFTIANLSGQNLFAMGDQATALQRALKALAEQGLKPVASHGEKIPPSMDEASEALKKLLAQISGADALAKAKLYEAALTQIGGASKLTKAEQEDFAKVFQTVIEKYSALGPAGASVVDHFRALAGQIPLVATPLKDLAAILPDVVEPERDWNEVLQGTALYAAGGANVIGYLAEKTQLEKERIEALAEAMGPLTAYLPEINEDLGQMGDELRDASDEADHFRSALGAALNGVGNTIVSALEGGGDIGKAVGAKIGQNIGNALGQAASDSLDNLLGDALGEVLPIFGALLGKGLGKVFSTVGRWLGLGHSEGYYKDVQANKDLDALRADLLDTYGTLENIAKAGGEAGKELVAAWGDKSAKGLAHFQGLLADFNEALAESKARLEAIRQTGSLLDADSAAYLSTLSDEEIASFVSGQAEAGVAAIKKLTSGTGAAGLADLSKALAEAKTSGSRDDVAKAQAKYDAYLKAHPVTASEAGGIGGGVAGIAAQILESGGTMADVIDQLGPYVQSLREQFTALGVDGGAAFTALAGSIAYASDEAVAPLLEKAQGAGALMTSLYNIGRLDTGTFKGLAASVLSTRDQLVAMGKGGTEMSAALQPQLQKIWEIQRKTGWAVDDATQAMIDEALAAGTIGTAFQSPADQMLGSIDKLVERMGEFIDAILGVPKAIEKIPDDIDIDARVRYFAEKGESVDEADGTGGGSAYHRGGPVMHTGGLIARALAKAHQGMLVGRAALAADEVPIIARRYEGILSADKGMPALAETALNALNAGRAFGGVAPTTNIDARTYNTFNVDATDAESFADRGVREIGPKLFKASKRNEFQLGTLLADAVRAL